MEKLVAQGLVRSIGISNFSVKKIKVAPGKAAQALACLAGFACAHAHRASSPVNALS